MPLFTRLLRAGETKLVKRLGRIAAHIDTLEAGVQGLTDVELRAKTDEFRARHAEGESLDELLPEAFAVVREAAVRTIGQRHFTVQLMGGAALHLGNIAEMKTGEGKTLTSVLPAYLNALSGKGVHLVTVNDYLARRDAEWMGRVHRFLGLSVGVILAEMPPAVRREQYAADITYGTNNELGFDYLRDNMAWQQADLVQRGHNFAIVDEADSILIDEARTPLIISGPAEQSARWYQEFARMAPLLKRDVHYEVDERKRTVGVTEEGVTLVEDQLGIDNLYEAANTPLVGYLNNALKVKELFKRDKDYIVTNGQVLIVDEFTGRVLPGRRYNEGLHQAIEAKEGVEVQAENQTLATITLQNYFRLYGKLSGMTGTAQTEAAELHQIYKLGVVPIPTNRPMVRADQADLIYKTEEAKFAAVAGDIAEKHRAGQPVLVGTTSVEKSEYLSRLLVGLQVPHEVLNAKQHAREAAIVASMKQQVAAEAEEVKAAGGLYVLGTERHEARRIDNQLRGRSGRQGDPGESRFYLSLGDDLMRRFNGQLVESIMNRFNLPDDVPIEAGMVTKAIRSAQTQVEQQNFEIRKNVLKYDEVLNKQRTVIYDERRRVLAGEDIEEQIEHMLGDVVNAYVDGATAEGYAEDWDLEKLWTALNTLYPITLDREKLVDEADDLTRDAVTAAVLADARAAYAAREAEIDAVIGAQGGMRELERQVLLQVMDRKWREHLYEMDYLKEGIGLRAMAQRDPLIEYQREGYDMFAAMLEGIKEETVTHLFHVRVQAVPPPAPEPQPTAETPPADRTKPAPTTAPAPPAVPQPQPQSRQRPRPAAAATAPAGRHAAPEGDPSAPTGALPTVLAGGRPRPPSELQYSGPAEDGSTARSRSSGSPRGAAARGGTSSGEPARNRPCPCGSGRKYKHCHGAPTAARP